MSLRSRLSFFIAGLLVLVLAANLILVRIEHSRSLQADLDRRAATITSSIGLIVLPHLLMRTANLHLGEFSGLLQRLVHAQNDVAHIVIRDAEDAVVVSFPSPPPTVPDLYRYERTEELTTIAGGTVHGTVTVLFNLSDHETEVRGILLRLSVIALSIALLGVVIAFALSRKITRPLEQLRDGAVQFGKQNFATRVSVDAWGGEELGTLATTFNDMASRIERQIGRIRALQEWSREVASELDRERVIDVVVRAFSELGRVGKMSLMILNADTGFIEIVGGRGLHPDVQNFLRLKVGEGIAGKVIETGKVIRVDSLDDCAEYKTHTATSGLRGALLALPLVAKGRCFGVVNLHEKSDGTNFDNSDEPILKTLAEIAAVAFENSRLYDLAITDGLTKLFIVRYFHQRLEEEIVRTRRTSQPLSLLMLDIDHFKEVNDTYGHQAGDSVLVTLARLVRRVFREVDIPCRYGGEEFAIILPNTDKDGARIVGDRFRATVEGFAFSTPSGEIRLSVSVGLATYSFGKRREELIHEADSALYHSKRNGRNQTTHFAEMGS